MAKRMTKGEARGLGLLVVIALIVMGVGKILDAIGFTTALIVCAVVIVGFIWLKASQNKERLAYLRNKYRDESIVQGIIQHRFWEGQTSEQLIDSLGNPAKVDQRVLKTKKREIWKYNRQRANRYGLRITLDGDTVVGWDQKSHDG